jgi:hypothetical protein
MKENTREHWFRWEEDSVLDVKKKTSWDNMNWICLAQDKVLCQACVNTVMKFWIS